MLVSGFGPATTQAGGGEPDAPASGDERQLRRAGNATSPLHIGSILIYNPATAPGGFVRFKDILAFFESRMQLSKTMRQRLVRVPFDVDYPYWIEDPDFDLGASSTSH